MGKLWVQREKDKEKKEGCHTQGITLIEIPYWWDFKKESLLVTIHLHRPDLILSTGSGSPIPIESPKGLVPRGIYRAFE
jgi:hypothetical protein